MSPDPDSNTSAEASGRPQGRSGWRRFIHRRAAYPNEYVWFVFVSAMDVFMTSVVLQMGGREVNPIAELVLVIGGLRGMVIFKFAMVLFVVTSCQIIAQRRYATGRLLARAAVAITAVPMVVAFTQLVVAMWM